MKITKTLKIKVEPVEYMGHMQGFEIWINDGSQLSHKKYPARRGHVYCTSNEGLAIQLAITEYYQTGGIGDEINEPRNKPLTQPVGEKGDGYPLHL